MLKLFSTRDATRGHAAAVCALAFAAVLFSGVCIAQERARQSEEPGVFDRINNWFERQWDKAQSNFQGARGEVDNFNREAGVAARTVTRGTVDAAKDAADAVARLPKARVISGHAVCVVAANGAPDCNGAAASICKSKGFETGKSVDITSAENCPPRVMLSGRDPQPGECRTQTFVSRALCQ